MHNKIKPNYITEIHWTPVADNRLYFVVFPLIKYIIRMPNNMQASFILTFIYNIKIISPSLLSPLSVSSSSCANNKKYLLFIQKYNCVFVHAYSL